MKYGFKFLLLNMYMLGACAQQEAPSFRLGVENISPAMIAWFGTQRVGLITNQTGRDQLGRRTVDILTSHGITVSALLVPEHGMNGDVAAAHDVHDLVDQDTGISIISLYGNGTGKKLSASTLKQVDVLVFDIQDSGMRHYTYISTLFYAVDGAAEHDKPLVVLDRPNPLGRLVEGPLVDPTLKSFIAVAPIPLRHGMTVGELAQYFNTMRADKKAALCVVPMHGYHGQSMVAQMCPMNLSPNIQNVASCYGYSFLGLLGEIRPFDVGIGTPLAFQCIMLPQDMKVSPQMWHVLGLALEKQGVANVPHTYYSTRKKKQMVGLRIEINDITKVSTCKALSTIMHVTRTAGVLHSFAQAFDTAVGSLHVRSCFDGTASWSAFMQTVHAQLKAFCEQSSVAYMYQPLPTVVF